jgi:hypothetical protein
VEVALLSFEGCPNREPAALLLDRLAAEFPDVVLRRVTVETDAAPHSGCSPASKASAT